MFRRRLRYVCFLLGSFVLISFVSSIFAENESKDDTLHVKEAWSVNEHGVLFAISDYFKTNGNFELPDEIDTDGFWGGVVLTDGEELFTVVSLTMKDDDFNLEEIDTEDFRNRLSKNGWIDAHRYERDWKMQKRDNRLVLYSGHFPEKRLVSIDVDSILQPLRDGYAIAMSTAYPENKLYPELPEEKEGEPPFIKMVREERNKAKEKNNSKEPAKNELYLLGLRWNNKSTGTLELITIEEDSENRKVKKLDSRPFEVAGFYQLKEPPQFKDNLFDGVSSKKSGSQKEKKNSGDRETAEKTPDAPSLGSLQAPEFYVTGAYRFVPEVSDSGDENLFCLYLGSKIIPKEERKAPDFHRHFMQFGFASVNSLKSLGTDGASGVNWKDTYMIQRGNICLFYPKQPENLPPEEGQPGPEILDEINRKVAEAAFPIAEIASKVFGKLSFDFPIDIGLQVENGVAYFGMSLLSEKEYFDENALESLWNYVKIFESIASAAINETVDELKKHESITAENNKSNELLEFINNAKKMFGEKTTENGISYTRVTIPNKDESEPGTTIILGFGKNFLCGAFPTGTHLSTATMLDYIIFPNLKNRVAESRRLKAEKPWLPRPCFQVRHGGNWFQGNIVEEGRKTTFSIIFPRSSLGELGTLKSLPGLDYVKMFVPELRL